MDNTAFNLDEPIAFFITWTTYGTWLPGDERGWNRKNRAGIQDANNALQTAAREKMTEPEFRLNDEHGEIVRATIAKHCEVRGWHPHVINPRSNHVHVVVTAKGYAPDTVMTQLKAWCTRNLKGSGIDRENIWTEGGSKRSINSEADLEQAVFYASEGQDRKGRSDS